MKPSFFYHGLLCTFGMAVVLPLHAAYNPSQIAADAQWVVHADFAALREGTLGKELISALEKAQGQATNGMIGLDIPKLLTTLGSLTAYGSNLTKDPAALDGALLVQGTVDLKKILESVLLQGTLAQPEVFTEVKDLPFPAYAVSEPPRKNGSPSGTPMQVIVAFPPEPVILVSKSRPQLLKARDVFRGSAPSLASNRASQLARMTANADGAYVFAASVVPADPVLPQNAPQARMLQLASVGSVAIGERGPDAFAHAELLASSEENAEKVMKILEGMTGLLSLAETNDKQLGDFLKARSVTRDKQTVSLRLTYPSVRLVQMTQALATRSDNRVASRAVVLTSGQALAEWDADAAAGSGLQTRVIDGVKLVNGAMLTLGRALNGGREARFDRVEVVPADGSTAAMIFRSEFFRSTGGRGGLSQFQFPGVDGTYSLKVVYANDPEGKARYAVSVRPPRPVPPAPPAPAAPAK